MQPGFQGLGFPGQFGTDLRQTGPVYGFLAIPQGDGDSSGGGRGGNKWRGKGAAGFFVGHDGCQPFSPEEAARVRGRVAVLRRGGCSFLSKTRRVEEAGGLAAILVDLEGLDFEAIYQAKAVVASQQQAAAAAAATAAAASVEQQQDEEEAGEESGASAGGQQEEQQQPQQEPKQQQRNPVYTSWQVMSDDGSGARVGIPATLVTELNAQVMLECLWWYMTVSPLAPKGGLERPEEAVFVRLAYDDVLAIEDGELMDLGPAPSMPERPQSMLDRVLGGLAELLGGGAHPTEQLDLALDSLAAEGFGIYEDDEEDEEEESDGDDSDGDEDDGDVTDDEEEDELEWGEEDEEDMDDWTAADIRTERQIAE